MHWHSAICVSSVVLVCAQLIGQEIPRAAIQLLCTETSWVLGTSTQRTTTRWRMAWADS